MSIGIKVAKMTATGSLPGVGSVRSVPMGRGYQGDPGFFGDVWGGIKGAVSGAVKGVLSGNPLGIIGGALGGAISGATGQRDSVMTATPPLPPMMTLPTRVTFQAQNGTRVKSPGVTGYAERLIPGGETGYEESAEAYRAGKASSIGHHWNKSGYFVKSGAWIAKGTKEVRNRRRNPLNPRALDRSISRITSAKRASKKLGRISIRKAQTCR